MYWLIAAVLAIGAWAGMSPMAAPSTQPKNFVKGVTRLSDGTGTPVVLVVPFVDGDYSLDGIMQHLNEEIIIKVRGAVIGLTRGTPSIPTGSLSAFVGNLVGKTTTAPGTFLEFVTGKGAYAANLSTLGASREITCDLRLTIEGTDWGDSADETIDCEDCVFTAAFGEAAEGNKLKWSWKVLGNVVITNDANTVTYSQIG